MKHFIVPARARGLIGGARADASPEAIFAALRTTVEEMRDKQVEELKGINAKFEDVVTSEQIDRINGEVTALTTALNEANAAVAALRVGGSGGDDVNPHAGEHALAFNRFFRKGVDAGLSDLEVKAELTTQSDPDGGYLVPTETAGTIDRVLGTISVMRQLATVMPIGTNEYKKLVNVGGAGGGWVGEEEARPETGTPSLREIILNTKELYANPATTQTMLDDGIIDIAGWLADEVAIVFSEKEGEAFISGNGVNQPRGLNDYAKVANGSYAWGSFGFTVSGKADGFLAATTAVNPADAFVDLYGGLKQGYRNGASWLMNDTTMTTVRKFKVGGTGDFIWNPPSAANEVETILRKPVYTDDYMPAVSAGTFPVAFGDFKRTYLIVDRMGIRVLRDPFTNKPRIHFYTTKRVGGGAVNFESMKFMKIST
jgi:HK97 family phage major capsid protein